MLKNLKTSHSAINSHPNSEIYGTLSKILDTSVFNLKSNVGLWLEDNPCLRCAGSIEKNYSNLKLNEIRTERKFTDCVEFVKLNNV
jgi:hypothetical protein